MFRKAIIALFIIVAISAVIASAFAISNNKNSSNNIISNQLTPLKNNPSSSNSNLTSSNNNKSFKNSKITLKNDGSKTNTRHSSKSIRHLNKHKIKHLPNTSVISSTKAQEIAAKYIEQPGATTGTPKLVNQNGKEVYIVPVMLKSKNVGEIDIDAHDGSNLGGAGGLKN
jgi:uncharacterized membrane protein YkoI